MRAALLSLVIGLFGVAGTIFVALSAYSLVQALQTEPTDEEWPWAGIELMVSTSTSLWLLIAAALCFVVALLAFIANVVAEALVPDDHTASESVATWPSLPARQGEMT